MTEVKFEIKKSTGGSLHAIHYICSDSSYKNSDGKAPLVILCHGFTGDKSEWGRFPQTALAFNKEGIDAIFFDFSGSGQNERELITLSKQGKDLEEVYGWAETQGYSWIAVLGLSFGGLTTLIAELPSVETYIFWAPGFYISRLLSEGPINIVSALKNLENPPFKMPSSGRHPETGKKYKPIIIDKSFIESIESYEIDKLLESLNKPTIVVQGTADVAVKPEHTREAFSHLPQDEHHKLVLVENATHDFKDAHLKEFIDVSIEWFKRYLLKVYL